MILLKSIARLGVLEMGSFLFPVTVSQFNTELQRCLIFCGLDSAHYKSHNFRICVASHAAEMGFTDMQIRTLGRWKSDGFKLHIRNKALQAN